MKNSLEDFITRAKEVHKGENLDYSHVKYINNRTPVMIIDHDLRDDGTEYGVFWQTPYNHLRGQSHPGKRSAKISRGKLLTQENIINRFKEVHKGENLDYSKVIYNGMHVKVEIISHDLRPDGTEYGSFWQEPVVHLKGCTHPDIGRVKTSEAHRYDNDTFIRKAKIVHYDADYDYSDTHYVDSRTKIAVNCKKIGSNGKVHGIFYATPDNFLMGKGCPKCGNLISKAEDDIYEHIKAVLGDVGVFRRDKSLLNGKELDIYIPSIGIAFEYNGLRWHSELFGKDRYYHLDKKRECEKKGVILFHIFEDEYAHHRHALFSKIDNILGVRKCKRIGARKCEVKVISNNDAMDFLDLNHIQGFVNSTMYLGLFYKEKLLSVMTFKKENKCIYNLTRFATDCDYIVPGAASKLFSYFKKNYAFNEIKTFLDRRWGNSKKENLYDKLGFKIDNILKPDYSYTNGHGERKHKFLFRKKKLHKKYGFPTTMTESEMTDNLGYYRIWNCGLIKYVYKKKDNFNEFIENKSNDASDYL